MWLAYKLSLITNDEYGNVQTMICQKKLQQLGIMGYGIFHAEK
jgi:hypothetical protein